MRPKRAADLSEEQRAHALREAQRAVERAELARELAPLRRVAGADGVKQAAAGKMDSDLDYLD